MARPMIDAKHIGITGKLQIGVLKYSGLSLISMEIVIFVNMFKNPNRWLLAMTVVPSV
jgi:hypothetical protein